MSESIFSHIDGCLASALHDAATLFEQARKSKVAEEIKNILNKEDSNESDRNA